MGRKTWAAELYNRLTKSWKKANNSIDSCWKTNHILHFCLFCSTEVTSGHCMACKCGSQMILHDICTSTPSPQGGPRTPNNIYSMTQLDMNRAASSTPAS